MEHSHRGVRWVLGLLAVAFVIAGGVWVTLKITAVNPRLSEIEKTLKASPQALGMLGERQEGAGYSFRLPKGFVPAEAPATSGLPEGTESWSWVADEEAADAGSEFRIWILPKEYSIASELDSMKTTGNRLDAKATIADKSSFRRIGERFLAVRALLDGSDDVARRVGVIYILTDGNRTVMAIGMGVGPKAKDMQYLLDHAVRTIRRE